MKLKHIATIVVLLASLNVGYAQSVQLQFPTEKEYKDENVGGGVSYHDSKMKSLYSIEVNSLDSNTTLYYPLSRIADGVNFSYFTNSALVQVHFSIHSSIPIENMSYSITSDNDWPPRFKKLNGKFVRQNEPDGSYTTKVFLEPLVCSNQVFTIRLDNSANPEGMLKQIVSTVPVKQPKVFAKLIGEILIDSIELNGIREAKRTQRMKNLENANLSTLDMQEIAGGRLFLNTDNYPFVYSVVLVRNTANYRDTLPIQSIWDDASGDFKFIDGYSKTYMAAIPVDMIKKVGKYELLIEPAFMKSSKFKALYADKTASIKFEVYPSNTVDLSVVLLLAFLFLLAVLLFFIWYKRRQKRRIKQQQQLTREAKLKLEAVRSQLNPHFVFNSLAGIQNLMNKNEIDKAHNYLVSFSRITRSVLDHATKELMTVDEEIKWLKDYLEMEQLRFGFAYDITVDKNLDQHNVEIPVMLVQPFVENAVKHGISSLKEAGHITISFQKMINDMQVMIVDNGKGFDATKDYSGAGLSLSKSRIDLLNTIYKNNTALLRIDSHTNGTKVIITLKNWL